MSATAAASQSVTSQEPQPRIESDAPIQSQNNQRRKKPRPKRGGNGGSTTPGDQGGEVAPDLNGSQPTQHTRGRGGRARASGNAALAFRPANVAPSPTPSHDTHSSESQQVEGQRGQRGRGGRGATRGGRQQTRVTQTREFGGTLTTTGPTQSSGAPSLQPNAPEFKPGQEFPSSTQNSKPAKPSRPPRRRFSKSTAPDIATRIHEDIDNSQYECPICTSEVLRKSKVWSCHTCWTVFHLDCIKKWSNNPQPDGPQNSESATTPRQWRCPGCNLPQDTKPSTYACWCEKETEPRPISGLPPHSCGQTCGKSRLLPKKCPHPCELLCHAGPCPPCTHVGPTQRCFCGKESSSKRCVDTNYDTGWSCGKPCGDVMPCGDHTCPRECHEGLCGACEVRVDAKCYCGKDEKAILCCDKDDEVPSKRVHVGDGETQVTEEWTGVFQCFNECGRYFDCGKHQCQKSCHATVEIVEHCPRAPDLVSSCPCGKTPLSEISDQPRQSCEDIIPNCSKICLKELSCGHGCQQTCHTGECLPCLQKVTIHCRCGRSSFSTICHQGTEEPPQCTRTCKTTLNCGRHTCGERCCSGERRAVERQSSKRKQRPLNSTQRADDTFEAEHICTRACGRLLKCGTHTCEELCHKGPCGSCREAIFDEISCHCGRTVLQPPLPCGTIPPACRFNCERPRPCGHPQVEHNCHTDDESCPKCPFLTQKECVCGKKTLKNQQCWFTDVRCGEICGKKLRCGSHTCRSTCHKPGECEDHATGTTISCHQPCGKPKKCCGHPCEETCHAPYPCREEKPCSLKTIVTCACQNIKNEVRCSASKTNAGNATKVLPCNDECARLERNRKLALALDIDPATHTDDFVPYSAETLSLYQSSNLDAKWLKETEGTFRIFAADMDEKRMRFKPMPPSQRSFLHALATDFGLDSESMDPEPHRHVAVFKTPRFVSAPTKTLRDCVRIKRNQAIEAHAAQQERQAEKARISNITEPYNGLLLTNPRFALTIDELASECTAVLGPPGSARISFNIQFLPSGDVALKSQPANHTERTIDLLLKEVKTPLARELGSHGIGSLQLARFDDSLNVLRKESDDIADGGWSRVAAKAAAPKRSAPPTGPVLNKGENGYTVLGNLAARKKAEEEKTKRQRKQPEEVVEDWETAEIEAERLEEEVAVHASTGAASATGASTGIEVLAASDGAEQDAGAGSGLDEPHPLSEEDKGPSDAEPDLPQSSSIDATETAGTIAEE